MGSIITGNLGDGLKTHMISSVNSTSSILGAGATFVGAWEDVEKYATAAVSISGNLASEPGILYFELSQDGSTVHAVVPAAVPNNVFFDKPHILNIVEKYIRISYTNGATPQTVFNLQTKFSNAQQLGLLNAIGEEVYDTSEGTIVKAVINGSDPNNVYRNVGVNNGGALEVTDFLTEVSSGNVPNHYKVNKFGFNPQIDIGTAPEDVWEGGNDYTGQPVGVSETVDVFSNNSNDSALGTGAQTLQIEGLDATGIEQEEVIILNGTSAVTSVGIYSRVFRARVLTGSDNVGVITIRHSSTIANVFSEMQPGVNSTAIAAYTIPSNKTGLILSYSANMSRSNGSAGSAVISLRTRPDSGVYNSIRFEQIQDGGPINPPLDGGIPVNPGTDIKVRVESVSDNGTSVSASFNILLIDI